MQLVHHTDITTENIVAVAHISERRFDERFAAAKCVTAVATETVLPASPQTRVVEAAVTTLVRVAACNVCEIRLGDGPGHQNAPYANTCAAPTMHVSMQSCSGRTDSITSLSIVGTLACSQ